MMLDRDTVKYRTVAYATLQGNPPQPRAIIVMTGTGHFEGPDNFTVNYTLDVCTASADADMDGFPDTGVAPVISLPGTDHAARVAVN